VEAVRPAVIGWLLVLAWVLVMAMATAWLPAYHGTVGASDRWGVFVLFLVVAVLAAVKLLRSGAQTRKEALVSSVPAIALIAAVAVSAYAINARNADVRGEPLFLFLGIALWASWAGLVLSTALFSRARWNRVGGLGVTLLVALLGLFMAIAELD
jgi:cation transport ATPase